ncbi:hypothetical protein [Sphingomonas sp. CFBP 13706]|uniref:hypothetical protein n=1 Tax=Sphingomonas sp. CFBP 13706 TaxID=2775314 RepID=UPI0017842CA1|nr:hypothetical protein [Sphingomonas sp. CFBP 13706]MBD8734912.1 hypothetical protein [Sphingomonas sp. CFBP 13706]
MSREDYTALLEERYALEQKLRKGPAPDLAELRENARHRLFIVDMEAHATTGEADYGFAENIHELIVTFRHPSGQVRWIKVTLPADFTQHRYLLDNAMAGAVKADGAA